MALVDEGLGGVFACLLEECFQAAWVVREVRDVIDLLFDGEPKVSVPAMPGQLQPCNLSFRCHAIIMGCGGNHKDVASVVRVLQPTPQPNLQPQTLRIHPSEKSGKLPQPVLEGMCKILHIPMKVNKGRRAKPKTQAKPFAGIIEDPVQSVPGLRNRPPKEKPPIKKEDSTKPEITTENPFPGPAQDDLQKELRKEIEGEEAAHSKLQEDRKSQAQAGSSDTEAAKPTPLLPLSDPTVQSSIPLSTDAWVGAHALDPILQNPLSSDYFNAEEEVHNLAAAPERQRPTTSQAAAAERLAKLYNQERGLSPEPPEEFSEEEYDGVIDEARRQARFAREKVSEEEAQRLAAERRAEEECLLAQKAAYMDAKKSEAANILSKYQ